MEGIPATTMHRKAELLADMRKDKCKYRATPRRVQPKTGKGAVAWEGYRQGEREEGHGWKWEDGSATY